MICHLLQRIGTSLKLTEKLASNASRTWKPWRKKCLPVSNMIGPETISTCAWRPWRRPSNLFNWLVKNLVPKWQQCRRSSFPKLRINGLIKSSWNSINLPIRKKLRSLHYRLMLKLPEMSSPNSSNILLQTYRKLWNAWMAWPPRWSSMKSWRQPKINSRLKCLLSIESPTFRLS